MPHARPSCDRLTRDATRCAFTYPVAVTWMRKRDHNIVANAASLLICGLLAGVVVAAAAFPAVAMSGLAAKAGAETFDKLPTELTLKRPPQISYVYASDGKTPLATMYDENRRDVKLKDISPIMQKAMIAAEDHNFYKHNGVDVKGIARAFVANNQAGATQQGASTLTMQYVRLAIAYSATHPQDVVAATEDTSKRKLREMRYALQIDKEITKDEILERYLNIAPFGNGAYGVFAASQVYFGKQPERADDRGGGAARRHGQGAVGVRPDHRRPATRRRSTGATTSSTTWSRSARSRPSRRPRPRPTKLVVKGKRAPNGCVATDEEQLGLLLRLLLPLVAATRRRSAPPTYDRERRLKSGGYRIVTSLDVKAQDAAQTAASSKRSRPATSNALMVAAIEPGTGQVRALAVNRQLQARRPGEAGRTRSPPNPTKAKRKIRGTYPNTTNPLLTGGGDITGYQAGSTFKIFTHGRGAGEGLPAGYTINAQAGLPVEIHRRVRQPGRLPGHQHVLPAERQRQHGRRAQHVERLRRLGQHLLRAARGAGRRGERGRRGQADRHQVPGGPGRRQLGQRQGCGQPVGRVHARRLRHDAAGARQRVRDAGRRRQVLRADPGAGDHRPGRQQARRRQPALPAAPCGPRSPGPRSTPPAARSATTPPPRGAAARTAGVVRGDRRQAGRRQDRHHRRARRPPRWS